MNYSFLGHTDNSPSPVTGTTTTLPISIYLPYPTLPCVGLLNDLIQKAKSHRLVQLEHYQLG